MSFSFDAGRGLHNPATKAGTRVLDRAAPRIEPGAPARRVLFQEHGSSATRRAPRPRRPVIARARCRLTPRRRCCRLRLPSPPRRNWRTELGQWHPRNRFAVAATDNIKWQLQAGPTTAHEPWRRRKKPSPFPSPNILTWRAVFRPPAVGVSRRDNAGRLTTMRPPRWRARPASFTGFTSVRRSWGPRWSAHATRHPSEKLSTANVAARSLLERHVRLRTAMRPYRAAPCTASACPAPNHGGATRSFKQRAAERHMGLINELSNDQVAVARPAG